jgi:hypothetical protein
MHTNSPSPAVLAKVAALLQAIDETPISAPLDVSAIRAQLADRDVAHWLDAMYGAGVLTNYVDSERVTR